MGGQGELMREEIVLNIGFMMLMVFLSHFLLRVRKRFGETFNDAELKRYVSCSILTDGLGQLGSMVYLSPKVTKCIQEESNFHYSCRARLYPTISISGMFFLQM